MPIRRQLAGHQRLLQALAHQLLELPRRARRDLRCQRQLVALRIELAVDLERRNALDGVAHQRVADRDARTRRPPCCSTRWSISSSRTRACCRRSRTRAHRTARPAAARCCWRACSKRSRNCIGVDFLALPQHRHRPPRRRGLPPGRRRLDLGGAGLGALEQVLLHAEEGERNDQQAEDHGGDPAGGLVAEFLQHRSACAWT